MQNDKRQFRRVSCEVETSFKNLDQPAKKGIGETTISDISEGGVRFRSNHFVPVQDRLLVTLKIPGKKLIETLAKPAWIREIPSVGQFDIGCQFLSLSDEDRAIIRSAFNFHPR